MLQNRHPSEMTTQTWTRLVRFLAQDNKIYYGDLITPINELKAPYEGVQANIIEGDPMSLNYSITNETRIVQKLLAPLEPEKIPLIRMVGLNYRHHILEAGKSLPSSPTLFLCPNFSVNDPFNNVTIPKISQDGHLDYEGELVIVVGKTGKNIPINEAEAYIAGYSIGNDVSSRKWQKENGTQWCFSKGFDGFAPFGPWITKKDAVDFDKMYLRVRVNDEKKLRQMSPVNDQLFKPADVLSFFSQGTTIPAGTLIFTGTPHGVGFATNPPGFLKNNDVVTVSIDQLGEISNKMVYE